MIYILEVNANLSGVLVQEVVGDTTVIYTVPIEDLVQTRYYLEAVEVYRGPGGLALWKRCFWLRVLTELFE